ncbi:MAG: hypothetical protein JWP02_257, partial [Acidimicrobiales bacterium]|nr:hypothetical protein [Acidimicrobiales bacterium]
MRRVCALVAALGLVIAQTLLVAAPASAQGPDQVGWWSEVQQAPGPLPVNTVTGDNLMVGNDPTGPNAIAAVRFTVPASVDGASVDPSTVPAKLTLHVSANSVVGNPVVAACPILANWQPATGGSWGARPNYSCSPLLTATFSPAGDTATFQLTPALQRGAGLYDLALAPAPTKTDPFSVQFVPPGADALQLGAGSTPVDGTDVAPAEPAPAPVPESVAPFDLAVGGPTVDASPALPLTPAPAAQPSARPATPVANRLLPAPLRRVVSTSRGQQVTALVLLGAIGLGLWWF